MKKILTSLALLALGWLGTGAQPLCSVLRYDETSGVPSSHLSQLLQDQDGFMWFATWNGLCRFDGYEFRTFKPQVGDGCHMTTDHISNITLLPSSLLLCQVDKEYYMFDLHSYRFRNLTDEELRQVDELTFKNRQSRSLQKPQGLTWTDAHQTQWTIHGDGRLSYLDPETHQTVDYPLPVAFKALSFAMADTRGNLWMLGGGSIYQLCTDHQRARRLDIMPQDEVKCLFADSKGRYWVTTKEDKTVRVYDGSNDRLLGYLGADGRLHAGYTAFSAPVYCMYETDDGTLWLGTKHGGLYRLTATGSSAFSVEHFSDLPSQDVYCIRADRQGRLWVAMLGGGVCYTDHPRDAVPRFFIPANYPVDQCPRARYIYITKDDVMLVATSTGLLVAQLTRQPNDMHFLLHQREPQRKESLSCSATMDVAEDRRGRIFVSTESGGVNRIEDTDLLAPQLTFSHLREQFHVQANDVVQSLAPMADGQLMAIGSHLITLLDSEGQGRVLDVRKFNDDYRFSEAHALPLDGGSRWLIGLTDGAFYTTLEQMQQKAYEPRLVLTGLSVQGNERWAIARADTIVLSPKERSFTLHFAALDYCAQDRISYAFRLLPNEQWNYIGRDHSATLLDLEPGTYRMEIRCTDVDGQWTEQVRALTILVTPTFWESAWGQLTIVLLLAAIVAALVYTVLYIRRIKRQRHETLQAYLSLLEEKDRRVAVPAAPVPRVKTDDPMLERIMTFIEENIGNGEAGVGDMAAAAATSRSGLQRKLKQAMGITPQDLLREARIKHACQLLRQTDKTVAEVAYSCGFSDPKYFSRCFKQSTGCAPSEYRSAGES